VALALGRVAPGGTTILGATLAGAALGAWLDHRGAGLRVRADAAA